MSAFILKYGLLVYVGTVLALISGAALYNVRENAQIREDTRASVEVEIMQRTVAAIKEAGDAAETSRAMRAYCKSVGLLYDFANNQCREG